MLIFDLATVIAPERQESPVPGTLNEWDSLASAVFTIAMSGKRRRHVRYLTHFGVCEGLRMCFDDQQGSR